MFPEGIVCVCFMMYAIANFLVHLTRKGGVGWNGNVRVGEERGKEGEGMEWHQMVIQEK